MPFGPLRPVFGGPKFKIKYFKEKLSFFFWVFYGSNDTISAHMNRKRMSNSKSAHQITLGGTKTRKLTYDVIKGH